MISKNELFYKLETIINYLKENNGYDYKLYNNCPLYIKEPDSNIVEYAEDVLTMVKEITDYPLEIKEEDLPF